MPAASPPHAGSSPPFADERPRDREGLPGEPEERLLLCVVRFISAAYETSDAACWDAAHACAEAARGVLDGTLVVARAAAVIRLIRGGRPRFSILPPLGRWISDDEATLLRVLRDARDGMGLPDARPLVGEAAGADLLARAISALVRRGNGIAGHPFIAADGVSDRRPLHGQLWRR